MIVIVFLTVKIYYNLAPLLWNIKFDFAGYAFIIDFHKNNSILLGMELLLDSEKAIKH